MNGIINNRKPGVVVQYEGHYGNITAVSCHKATNINQVMVGVLISSSWNIVYVYGIVVIIQLL